MTPWLPSWSRSSPIGPCHSRHGWILASCGALPRTIRFGLRPVVSRTVSVGLSVRTVPAPTRIASLSARSWCTSARASGLVIHFDVPSAAAVFPSSVAAILTITQGRPVRLWCRYGSSCAVAAPPRTFSVTSILCCWSMLTPPPLTLGSGSFVPTRTRANPFSMSALAQLPVRPRWEHGSRVVAMVAPCSGAWCKMALSIATFSACRPPTGSVAPV